MLITGTKWWRHWEQASRALPTKLEAYFKLHTKVCKRKPGETQQFFPMLLKLTIYETTTHHLLRIRNIPTNLLLQNHLQEHAQPVH
jgi:hypothetical protein